MSDDPIRDLTEGLIGGLRGTNTTGKITIGRVVKGDLTVVSIGGKPQAAEGEAEEKPAKEKSGKGPDIVIGDIAGGSISHTHIDIRITSK